MHDVAWIKPESSGIHLITLIGESKLFQAKIKSIDLVNGSRPADSPTEGDLLVRVRRIEGQAPKTKRSVS